MSSKTFKIYNRMLSSVSKFTSFSRYFEITIDGKKLEAIQGETIMMAAARNHIQIPRACGSYFYQGNECGLCKVLVDGKSLKNACSTLVYKGLDVKTKAPEVVKAFPEAMKKFRENDDLKLLPKELQPHIKASLDNMEQCMVNPDKAPTLVDDTAIGIRIDPHKCTKCNKCVPVCPSNSLVLSPYVQAFGNNGLAHAFCNSCGKCAEVCDSKSITFTNHVTELGTLLEMKDYKKVAIIDHSVCINLERLLKLPRGSMTIGKLSTALLKNGFDYVFDSAIASDIALVEEAQELANHVVDRIPLVSAFCPSMIQTVQHYMPEAKKILSTVISPPLIAGLLSKTDSKRLSISFTNCVAHKVELAHYNGQPQQYNNMALSVEELADFCQRKKIDFKQIPELKAASMSSQSGILSTTAEGWTEALIEIFSTKHVKLTEIKKDYEILSNLAKIIKLEIKPGVSMRFGIAYSKAGLEQLLTKQYNDLLYVCVASCEGGCLNGVCGSKGDRLLKENMLKDHAHRSPYRQPLENPLIKKVYEAEFANPETTHMLMHNGEYVAPKSLFEPPKQQNAAAPKPQPQPKPAPQPAPKPQPQKVITPPPKSKLIFPAGSKQPTKLIH